MIPDAFSATDALAGDFDRCAEELERAPANQFWRRMLVRCAISMIEGYSYAMRRAAMQFAIGKQPFNMTQYFFLSDDSYRLGDTGQIEPDRLRLRLSAHVAFTVRALADAAGAQQTDFFGGEGWRKFKAAIEVRNRLTHPKLDRDVHVSDEDIATIHAAVRWFCDCQYHIFSTATAVVNRMELTPPPWHSSRSSS